MMTNHTLEERVNIAYRRLVLILTAAATPEDHTTIDTDELLSAIQESAEEAAAAIEPLRHAPANIGNWTPPEPMLDEDIDRSRN